MNKMGKILQHLIDAAEPFTSGNIVDETIGTISLMEKLEYAIINEAKCLLYDIRIYDRAITKSEISRNYEIGEMKWL